MYMIDFKCPISIHFIGIGGIGMSGLAMLLRSHNFKISGSDWSPSFVTKELEKTGIPIAYGPSTDFLPEDTQLVVYTAAVSPTNLEYQLALSKNLPLITRGELLGLIMKQYSTSIGVSGTHGKTSTTSMLTHIFLEAKNDATISIGGILPAIGSNIQIGHSDIFLAEACEYTNSFLSLYPTMALILNIEADHLDFFSGIEEIRSSFHTYMSQVSSDGYVLINADIDDYKQLTDDLSCQVITFSYKDSTADFFADAIQFNDDNYPSFDLYQNGVFLTTFELRVPGRHNISNALAAITASIQLGIELSTIQNGLLSYTGVERRFQRLGTFKGMTVIDDYAHHPHEIRATLKTASHYPHNRLWCIFQPHTYSRTKALFDEFVIELSKCDISIVADIFPARETDTLGMHSSLLTNALTRENHTSYTFPTFDEIIDFIQEKGQPGDMIIVMGAGDIKILAHKLIQMNQP